MSNTTKAKWESKRTKESREVERVLREAGFEQADAYRYNIASIRVRVIDSRFEKRSIDWREKKIDQVLSQLPQEIQADIVSVFAFAPSELQDPDKYLREHYQNFDFENPRPSQL